MKIFKFKLGAQARDTVTGFEGTITGRNEWLNGCKQYCLKAKVGEDGKIKSGEWIDEQQVEIVKPAKEAERPPIGGPQADAPNG